MDTRGKIWDDKGEKFGNARAKRWTDKGKEVERLGRTDLDGKTRANRW